MGRQLFGVQFLGGVEEGGTSSSDGPFSTIFRGGGTGQHGCQIPESLVPAVFRLPLDQLMSAELDPQLQNFIKRLVDQAINAAIHSIFWKMPLVWAIGALVALVGAAIYFKIY
jgi:hypothetical protein